VQVQDRATNHPPAFNNDGGVAGASRRVDAGELMGVP
jgi:hypothetical protein